MRVYKHLRGSHYYHKILLVVYTGWQHPGKRLRSDIIFLEIRDGHHGYITCLRKTDIMHQTARNNIRLPHYDMYSTSEEYDPEAQSCLPYYLLTAIYTETIHSWADTYTAANRFGGYIGHEVTLGDMIYRVDNSDMYYLY